MIRDIWQNGGLTFIVLVVMGAITGLIFLKQLFHLHRAQIKTVDFLDGIFTILRKGNVVEAISQCEDTPGPVAQLVRAAILAYQREPRTVRTAMDDLALVEIPRLERNVSILLTLSQIAPMIGLLGTVVGMLDILQVINLRAPVVYANDLAGGLWQAMSTTAAGLLVAILAYIGHNVLVSRVDSIVLDMERAYTQIMLSMEQVINREERDTTWPTT